MLRIVRIGSLVCLEFIGNVIDTMPCSDYLAMALVDATVYFARGIKR